MTERTLLGVRIPEELKQLVDADRRTNQEIVEAALWREFGGQRKSALQRRVDEKQRRISTIESEKNERERELERLQDEVSALEQKLEAVESEQERQDRQKQQLLESLQNTPRDESMGRVIHVARELDVEPDDVVEMMIDQGIGRDV